MVPKGKERGGGRVETGFEAEVKQAIQELTALHLHAEQMEQTLHTKPEIEIAIGGHAAVSFVEPEFYSVFTEGNFTLGDLVSNLAQRTASGYNDYGNEIMSAGRALAIVVLPEGTSELMKLKPGQLKHLRDLQEEESGRREKGTHGWGCIRRFLYYSGRKDILSDIYHVSNLNLVMETSLLGWQYELEINGMDETFAISVKERLVHAGSFYDQDIAEVRDWSRWVANTISREWHAPVLPSINNS